MKSGASTASTMATNKRLASALPRNRADGGAGDILCASSTRLRCSRVQAWLRAVTEANRIATQRIPPAIWRDMAAVGSNASEKTTTTSSAKNSIPFTESRERHSSCRSLRRWQSTWPK